MFPIIIQGLLLSGLYALIAMGFMLIFSIGRTLNLAYGAYLMIGGYVYFWISQQLGFPQIVGFFGAIAVGILMGLMKHQFIVRPLKGHHVAVEISTLILAVVLQAGIVLVFGDSSKILLPIVPGVVRVAGATVTYSILTATVREIGVGNTGANTAHAHLDAKTCCFWLIATSSRIGYRSVTTRDANTHAAHFLNEVGTNHNVIRVNCIAVWKCVAILFRVRSIR